MRKFFALLVLILTVLAPTTALASTGSLPSSQRDDRAVVLEDQHNPAFAHTILAFDLQTDPGTTTDNSSTVLKPFGILDPASSTSGNAACFGLVDWFTDTVNRITVTQTLVAPLQAPDTSSLDPATLRDIATQLRNHADDQRTSNPPPAATELNSLMVDQLYLPLAAAIDQVADALEQNNMPMAMMAEMTVMEVGGLFDDGGEFDRVAAELELACPDELSQLDQIMGG